jgi:hypothetical protein
MLPFGVTIPATVPQGSKIPEGLMNNPVYFVVYHKNILVSPGNNIKLVSIKGCPVAINLIIHSCALLKMYH